MFVRVGPQRVMKRTESRKVGRTQIGGDGPRIDDPRGRWLTDGCLSATGAVPEGTNTPKCKINMTHPAFSFACTMLLAIVSSQILLTEAKPKFLLSCKVIAGICQNDGFCLDEMSIRFPDCYLEGQQIDSFQPKIGRPALIEEANASPTISKEGSSDEIDEGTDDERPDSGGSEMNKQPGDDRQTPIQ
ncbi:hypothetical protein GPALN_012635 [Globodera pallida]|nr:hypothetical protein GPALN_012635 [Globodera pallida]